MNRILFYCTAGVWVILALLHYRKIHRSGGDIHSINVGILLRYIFNASGLVGGFVLILCTFVPELESELPNLFIYVFAGGVATI